MASFRRSRTPLAALVMVLIAGAGACDGSTDAPLFVPDAGDSGPSRDATISDGNGGDDATPADANGGEDVAVDTGTDTGRDTGTDSGSDAGTDTGSGSDSGTDTGSDTGTDSGTDADDGSADAADGDGSPNCKTAFSVTALGSGAYQIDGQNNPTLDVCKGDTVTFTVNSPGHPFWIKTVQSTGTGNAYNDGVTNNGMASATITWVVAATAPTPLFYDCEIHGAMTGTINVH